MANANIKINFGTFLTKKSLLRRFKMAESFENKNNILRDWAKDKVQKSLAEALNRFEKPENER